MELDETTRLFFETILTRMSSFETKLDRLVEEKCANCDLKQHLDDHLDDHKERRSIRNNWIQWVPGVVISVVAVIIAAIK